MKKIAAMILGASISAGTTLGMTGCNNIDEARYATKLYDRLSFKIDKKYDLCGNDVDLLDYHYAIIKGDYTIGLNLTAIDNRSITSEPDILETRFVVDKEFYDKFTNSDLDDLFTLYTLSDEMIINYDPTVIKINGEIVYSSEEKDNDEDNYSSSTK